MDDQVRQMIERLTREADRLDADSSARIAAFHRDETRQAKKRREAHPHCRLSTNTQLNNPRTLGRDILAEDRPSATATNTLEVWRVQA